MRILVAEDLPVIAKSLCTMLRHYAVDVAKDGQAAWQMIETYDYDLLILEENLAKIDGVRLCGQARSDDRQMPILLISPRNDIHRKSIGLDAGADDYMVQPIDEEELVARVRALLRRGRLTQQPVMSWGDLQLEARSRSVTCKAKLLSLTPKEYALLELLLSDSVVANPLHERRVFSYGSIIEHLWIGDDSPGEEAVRTHVKGLRHKLKLAGLTQDPIETIYGVGYRLRPTPQLQNRPLSVLVADPDLAVTRELQQAGKSEDIDFQVVRVGASLSASSYCSSLMLALAANPGLLLLDAVALTNGDLAEVAALLQEIRRLQPDLVVLLWSQRSDLRLRQLALQYRVCRFLPKPIAKDEVIRVLRAIERHYLSPTRSILLFGFGAGVETAGLENYQLIQLSDPQLLWPTLQRQDPLLITINGADLERAIELCWLLRSDALWSDRPILLLTDTEVRGYPWFVERWDRSVSLSTAILKILA
jgi:DNA-binding response OmpR family regulator